MSHLVACGLHTFSTDWLNSQYYK